MAPYLQAWHGATTETHKWTLRARGIHDFTRIIQLLQGGPKAALPIRIASAESSYDMLRSHSLSCLLAPQCSLLGCEQ